MGEITRYGAILGNIWAISEDIGVISASVKSVMHWARPIQVVPGQFIFLSLFCLAVSDTLRYDIAQNSQYRIILLALRVILPISYAGSVKLVGWTGVGGLGLVGTREGVH